MMRQTISLRPDVAGCAINDRFEHYCTHKQTVLRLRKRKGKALKPSGFKAFSVAERMGFEPM